MPEPANPSQPEFMGGYGVAEERRNRIIKIAAVSIVAALVLGVGGYFFFRTWSQERTMGRFTGLVQQQDLTAAYDMWCPSSKPCRYYSADRFADDFGAQGRYHDIAAASVRYVDYCEGGVVFNFDYPGADDFPGIPDTVALWVQRDDGIVSFAPWPRCPGRHLNFSAFWNNLFGGSSPPAP